MVNFEKILSSFRNLKPDAVPQPPRPEDVPTEDVPTGDGENSDSNSTPEEIIIEPADSSEDEKKGNDKKNKKPSKNKFFSRNKKDKSKEPSSPINTQATGHVINIVQSEGVHWGNRVTYFLGSNASEKQMGHSEGQVKKTSDIKMLFESTIKPEHIYIDYISKNLGKNWHSFFRTLGYTQGRIETMEIDQARNGVSEARYQLLLDWVRNDDDGTLGHLSTLLWDDDERAIVKALAQIYTKEMNKFKNII